MAYVDGFVLAVPKQNIEAYKAMARKVGEIWKAHGALAYVECIGDDVPYGNLTSFPRAVQAKEDEIVAFSWIVCASREQRDLINAKVMADPRLKGAMSSLPLSLNVLPAAPTASASLSGLIGWPEFTHISPLGCAVGSGSTDMLRTPGISADRFLPWTRY